MKPKVITVTGVLPLDAIMIEKRLQLDPKANTILDLRQAANIPVFDLVRFLNWHQIRSRQYHTSVLIVGPQAVAPIFQECGGSFKIYGSVEAATKVILG
jgi:hypothetical protein